MQRVLTERGSASVFVVMALGVLMVAATVAAGVNGLISGHRRAQAVADLVALAGAGAQATDPCAAAGRVAEANRAALTRCVPDTTDVRVSVSIAGIQLFGWTARLTAEARAGR